MFKKSKHFNLLLISLIIVLFLSIFRLYSVKQEISQNLSLAYRETFNFKQLNLDLENKDISNQNDNFKRIKQEIDLNIIIDNNLFFPTKEEKTEIINPFIVLAISKQETNSKAILLNKLNNKSYIVNIGSEIEGYIVKELKQDMVILSYQKQELISSFKEEGN